MDEQKPKSREEILAAIKAKADAIRAQRAAAAQAPAAERPAAPATLETFVSSANAAGRPAGPAKDATIRAYGGVNVGVELQVAPGEEENVIKLIGGLGGYKNPLRAGAFQVDYRYYAEAKARLERAGYRIEEAAFGSLPPSRWTPLRGGWTRVLDAPESGRTG
ncbi:MAG TPA: hypothetical protein VNN19_07525 [bacterium]|nr:hypothetical protein [bacterium]